MQILAVITLPVTDTVLLEVVVSLVLTHFIVQPSEQHFLPRPHSLSAMHSCWKLVHVDCGRKAGHDPRPVCKTCERAMFN